MARHPDCPQANLPYGSGSISPHRAVMHRTIGRWGGDYSVLSRGSVPSVHFLIGQDPGQWIQFYDTTTKCAHAAGANDGVGIEFSGQNGEPLTPWQLDAGGRVIRWLFGQGIANSFLPDGVRVKDWVGFGNHSNVVTSPSLTHYDYITADEYAHMAATAASTKKKKRKPMFDIVATEDGHEFFFGLGTDRSLYSGHRAPGEKDFILEGHGGKCSSMPVATANGKRVVAVVAGDGTRPAYTLTWDGKAWSKLESAGGKFIEV